MKNDEIDCVNVQYLKLLPEEQKRVDAENERRKGGKGNEPQDEEEKQPASKEGFVDIPVIPVEARELISNI